ncbi:hypothetical protein ABMA28_017021 [Loxostege sticticalis]|uniref:Uncharacterized protein n=1 Tax=Loxostege sticticalis TaxID=481309 RepID=A0ABD0TAJ5_LOXSC
MPVTTCVVPGCPSKQPSSKLFTLPRTDALRALWMDRGQQLVDVYLNISDPVTCNVPETSGFNVFDTNAASAVKELNYRDTLEISRLGVDETHTEDAIKGK